MEQLLDIAGTIIRVNGADGDMWEDPGKLASFTTESESWDCELEFQVVDELPEPQGECVYMGPGRRVYKQNEDYITYIGSVASDLKNAYICKKRHKQGGNALIKRSAILHRINPNVTLMCMEVEHLVVANDGFLLHASCICHNGQGIVFTAPSGTGKSTQAALWKQLRDAEVINGDRIMIQKTDHGFDAVGIPFSGSSGICKNRRIPLAAIVYLSQAKNTRIDEMNGFTAFRKVWEGCSLYTWDRDEVAKCSEIVQDAVKQVPIFHLACTPDETAVVALEDVLERLR